MSHDPVVDENTCTGCETCVEICPMSVFVMEEGKAKPVNAKECIGCKACEVQCPAGSIVVNETDD